MKRLSEPSVKPARSLRSLTSSRKTIFHFAVALNTTNSRDVVGLPAECLLDLDLVLDSYDRALVNSLIAIFLERDVVVPRFHLNFHGSGFLQRGAVDDDLGAFGVALDLDA